MILFLCDLLKPINTLSEALQKSDINFFDVDTKVRATVLELEELRDMIENRQDHTEMYFSKCNDVMLVIDERTALQRRLRGDNFMSTDNFVRDQAIPLVYSLLGEISDAFTCHPVFKAFKALDPRELPDTPDQLLDYGMVSIRWY